MKRVTTKPNDGRDYGQMLKDYFGRHLQGMEVREEGGQMLAQVIYEDFRHIDTVRRELAQMMPEVEFTKLRREFTDSAVKWALIKVMWEEPTPKDSTPIIYVRRGENIMRTTLRDIAYAELRQLEFDADDEPELHYTEFELQMHTDEHLRLNALD